MRTILSVVGARPQFIKHAAVCAQLQQHFRVLTLHTGQHYDTDMSGAFFRELALPEPDYQLSVAGAATQSGQTGIMMAGIEEVCTNLRPDAILLYGDTNSTLAGALVAAKMHIPSIHVEAGLRSYNRAMPEEVNRIIADTFATILCCPTAQAVENLRLEGIAHSGVVMTGDVMCDMLEQARPELRPPLAEAYYFATIHRPYNTDDPARLLRILDALNNLGLPVIFPLHPRTATRMQAAAVDPGDYPAIRFIAPSGYNASLSYQAGARCVITDSGTIQREAYMLRRKCITLRSETEWNETLMNGWNTLVFEDVRQIGTEVNIVPGAYHEHLFGDGRAAEKIVLSILQM